jgi:cytochrome P450
VIPAARKAGCPLEPPAEFADWRNADGLQLAQWRGNPTWVVSRYDDIKTALLDPRLSADTIPDSMKTSPSDDMPVIFPRIDDPEHNRLRRMMTRDFTFRRAEAMRPQIQEMVDAFIDDMVAKGPPADLVRDFALPVPSLVISLLLGVPYEDHEMFQKNSTTGLDSRSTEEERVVAIGAMLTYMFDLVAKKEREPGDDLLSRLVTTTSRPANSAAKPRR